MIKFIINLFKRKKSKYYFEILKVKPKIKKEKKYIQVKFLKDFKGGETYNDIFKKEIN